MTEIIITDSQENPRGDGIDVEGNIPEFPGWTFTAHVLPEPVSNNDCHVCNFGRIADVSLRHEGQHYYRCPGDDYDGRDVRLTEQHYRMFDLIDRHFPPSPEERQALRKERDKLIVGIVARLLEVQQTEFSGVPEGVFREALRQAAHRPQGTASD